MVEALDEVDFALVAIRRAGDWVVAELSPDLPGDVDVLAEAVRRYAGADPAVAMLGLDEDYFLLLRIDPGGVRVLLSDAAAADEWDVAASALDVLGLPSADDAEDDDDGGADDMVGDLDLLADLGLAGDDLEDLLDDADLYPDELLSDVARAVGFGARFDDVVGLTPA